MKNRFLVLMLIMSFSVNAQYLISNQWGLDAQYKLFLTDVESLDDGGFLFTALGSSLTSYVNYTLLIQTNDSLEIEWVRRFESYEGDIFATITPSPSGGYFVGGSVRGSPYLNEGGSLYGINDAGEITGLHKVYKGIYRDMVIGIHPQPENKLNLFIRRRSGEAASKWLQVTYEGDVIFQKSLYRYPNSGMRIEDTSLSSSGYSYLTGTVSDTIFGHGSPFIAKLGESEPEWMRAFDIPVNTFQSKIAEGADGNILVLCSNYIDQPGSADYYYPVIFSVSENGSLEFAYRLESEYPTQNFRGGDIAGLPDGNILVSGAWLDEFYVHRGYLMKMTPGGDILWSSSLNNPQNENTDLVKPLEDGRILVASLLDNGSTAVYFLSENGESNCDTSLINITVESIDLQSHSMEYIIEESDLEALDAVVDTSQTDITETLICSGSTGISDIDSYANFEIYPNPTSGKFYLKGLNELEGVSIKIYNSQGLLCRKRDGGLSPNGVDLSELPGGLYFIQLISDGKVFTRKVIKY